MHDTAEPDREALAALATALRDGRIVLIPTDTIYGLSCRFDHEPARERIRLLKGPGRAAQFVALVDGEGMAWRHAFRPAPRGMDLLATHWPGPVTAVLSARPETVPAHARGPGASIALRWPRLDWLGRLVGEVGVPIVSTSANLKGETPIEEVAAARALFGDRVDLYLDLGPRPGKPSGLVDLTGDEPRWIRPL